MMLDIIKKLIGDKKEYRQMIARVKALPEEYQFVYKKIQNYMWHFASGDGCDMAHVQYELIDLFESGAAEGKGVLEITGEDVAAFSDELLRNTKTYTEKLRRNLNTDVMKKLGRKKAPGV